MKRAARNPSRRPDSTGRMQSDAGIRREKLRLIDSTGSTDGIHPKSLKRFWEKGYLEEKNGKTILTKRGNAVMSARIGSAGRGAVDFSTANRAGKSSRDHAARAQALSAHGGSRAAAKLEREHFAELEKEHKKKQTGEDKALQKIIGTYAVTIAPSDGSTLDAGNLADFRESGWIVAAAPTAPARIGSRLPGTRRERFDPSEPFINPSDPLGPLGEARAIVLRSFNPLDLDTLSTIRHHGFDLTPAPAKMRKFPPPPAPTRNPSPGVMIGGEHASAETRKMLAKALAWFGDENLVTEPQILKNYEAPQAAVEVGNMIAIEYESAKFDGELRIYRHDATRKRKLFISPDGATLIVWPPFKITKRGIEG